MKILHINDQAGVACILAKYQRRIGTQSKVLSYHKNDKFGIFKVYKNYVHLVDRNDFVNYCISEAKDADIVHIHSMEEYVIKIRKIYGKSKKIILHYHGTDIRGRNITDDSTTNKIKNKIKFFIGRLRYRLRLIQRGYYKSLSTLRLESQKLADEILVATPDLLSLLPTAKYLPNPVDVEHFAKDDDNHNKSYKIALTIKTESGNIEKLYNIVKKIILI